MADSVFITNTEQSVSETAGTALVSISRAGSLVGDVTVTYGVVGATATDGQDFVSGGVSRQVTIPAGVSRVTVPVQIINDTLPEPTETFVLSLISAQGATIAVPRTSRVSILDDETPAPPPIPEPPLVSNYNVTSTPVVSGLDQDQPIRFVFSPVDPSKIYVAERRGVIALSDLKTGATSTVIDLRSR